MFRRPLLSAFSALALIMGAAHASDQPAAPTLIVTVLTPDGMPATSAIAVTTVLEDLRDGRSVRPSYRFRPNASGTLTIDIPLSDPSIAAAYPRKRIVDVFVTVYGFGPEGVAAEPVAIQYLTWIMNIGDPKHPADLANVNGSTLRLVPLPATVPVPAPASRDAADAVDEHLTDSDTCYENPYPLTVSTCMIVTHPSDVRNERVVVAHNIGAGTDMDTSLMIDDVVGTSTSVMAGTDGLFLEAKGAVTLGEEVGNHFGFEGQTADGGGGPANEGAALLTDFARVEKHDCFSSLCKVVVTYVPDGVQGTAPALLPTNESRWHDYASPHSLFDFDCTVGIQKSYTNAHGVNRQETWTLGFDFQGSYKYFNLHANASIQTHSANDYRNSYVWTVSGSSKPFHHIFVHDGEIHESNVGSSCPVNSPGSTWTDASIADKTNPNPEADAGSVVPLPPPPPPAQDARRTTGRCAEAPERCGHE